MAVRAQPLNLPPLAGLGVAALVAALTLGSVALVGLNAQSAARIGSADIAAIRFTLLQAALSTAISIALAVPVARALACRSFPGRGLLLALLGAPFILPVIVAILGLLAVYGRSGLLSRALMLIGLPPLDIYGLSGVVLAHVFFNLPLATRVLLQGWRTIPAEHFRLAAQLGLDARAIHRRFEKPMLIASVPGLAATIFLLCLTSFAVALTLGGGPRATTIELAIYQAFRFEFDLGRAAALALVQFGLCALTAAAAWAVARPVRFGTGLNQKITRWDRTAFRYRLADMVAIAGAGVFLVLPLSMVVANGIAGISHLPFVVLPAFLRSLGVALASSLLCLILTLPLATAIVRATRQRTLFAAFFEISGYLSLAASPLVLGTGLFLATYRWFDPTALALPVTALVNAVMSLPFALRIVLPELQETEASFARLSAGLGLSGWVHFRLVTFPRLRPALGFAGGLAAALSMGDLGIIALFADADSATLPMLLFRLMGAYRMDAAAAVALLLVAASLALFLLFDHFGGRNADA